jgi:hypothetical protein
MPCWAWTSNKGAGVTDDRIKELEFHRGQVARVLEQAELNPGLHSDAVVSQARDEFNAIDAELTDLHNASAAHAQRLIEQTTGHRFSRPLDDAGEKAITRARTALDDAKQRAADAITTGAQEVRAGRRPWTQP